MPSVSLQSESRFVGLHLPTTIFFAPRVARLFSVNKLEISNNRKNRARDTGGHGVTATTTTVVSSKCSAPADHEAVACISLSDQLLRTKRSGEASATINHTLVTELFS